MAWQLLLKEDLWHEQKDGMLWMMKTLFCYKKSLNDAIDQTMEFDEQRENKSMPF